MIIWQALIQASILASLLFLLSAFFKQFKDTKTLQIIGIVLIMFTIGFAMRLTQNEEVVNLGYYLTEISYLFTYLLFTAALILGQKKYWNIK